MKPNLLSLSHLALMLIFVSLAVLLLLSFQCASLESWYYEARYSEEMQASLGFVTRPVTFKDPDYGGTSQVLSIDAVRPGGLMDRAGLSKGDIIVNKNYTHGFYPQVGYLYRWLHESKGSSVTIYIVRATDNPRTYGKTRRELTILVPQ